MGAIRGQQLTTFDVAPDGETVSLHFVDDGGAPGTLILPTDCLSALMMTLPEILRQSVHLRCQDQSMRLVYPVGDWKVEGSGVPGTLIVTLGTPDGFQVCFAVPALDLLRMAAIGARACPKAAAVMGN
ncbi:MAG TPA: hypothetical protein VEL75_01205 [Candidatus Methylomirabilis sp.]|nr:hypothetical protein [Candidatus Methylomirabilis sp.]